MGLEAEKYVFQRIGGLSLIFSDIKVEEIVQCKNSKSISLLNLAGKVYAMILGDRVCREK